VTFGFVDRGGSSVGLVWAQDSALDRNSVRLSSSGLRPVCCPFVALARSPGARLHRDQCRLWVGGFGYHSVPAAVPKLSTASRPKRLLQRAAFRSYAAVAKCTEIRNLRLINLEGG
jgi:hypothetical protein